MKLKYKHEIFSGSMRTSHLELKAILIHLLLLLGSKYVQLYKVICGIFSLECHVDMQKKSALDHFCDLNSTDHLLLPALELGEN